MKDLELFEYIKANQITSIENLATSLGVSNATARRRLNELQAAGLLKLVRGGKVELIDDLELSTADIFKQRVVGLDKQLSSAIAASKVRDGDIIFIDNGTTVREMLKHLTQKNVKIYTNGVYHMLNNSNLELDLNIIPGELLNKEASIVGAEAISYLSTLKINKAFIGANGFDQDGVYTPHRREMVIKEFALRHADIGYVVVEEKKRNLRSKYQICTSSDYQIITENTL